MGKPLKVLFIEDRQEDMELVLRELKKAGYEPFYERVENSRQMVDALSKQEWDIVLSDYFMQSFTVLEALKILRDMGFTYTPFIIISGNVGEELAVEAIKKGANNYLYKNNLIRLPLVIEQELSAVKNTLALADSEKAILLQAREWEATFNAISDLVMLLDNEGKILNCNAATLNFLKNRKADVVGRYCYELIHGLTERINDCPIEQMKKTLSRQQKILILADKYLEVTVDPILDEKGNLIQSVHVVSDITERKQAEEVLKRDKDALEMLVSERTAELINAQKELENMKRLSDVVRLAATVAHELRNPLGVIKTAIYNIEQKKTDSTFDKHLLNIDKKILESEQIINNLVSFSRIKMPNYQSLDVSEILKDCLSQSSDKYSGFDVEVRTEVNSKEKTIIEADSTQITEIFSNILDNAYQAFPDKKGLIEIGLDYDTQANKLDIRFKDNGIGIEEKDLENVFYPFFTTRIKGVGLGLTVCKQLVTLSNGTIDISGAKNKGTIVTISLPIKQNQTKPGRF